MIDLVTLGPTGTCHERAVIAYMGFQGVEDFEIDFIGDFFDGLEKIRGRENAFLSSAAPIRRSTRSRSATGATSSSSTRSSTRPRHWRC
jgi:hypothetical protein